MRLRLQNAVLNSVGGQLREGAIVFVFEESQRNRTSARRLFALLRRVRQPPVTAIRAAGYPGIETASLHNCALLHWIATSRGTTIREGHFNSR